jgi:translation elongation factor EF-Ts
MSLAVARLIFRCVSVNPPQYLVNCWFANLISSGAYLFFLPHASEKRRANWEMLEKIAMGKLNKFYKENTLLNQEFINDSKVTIREYLQKADKNLTVTAFKRLQLGA